MPDVQRCKISITASSQILSQKNRVETSVSRLAEWLFLGMTTSGTLTWNDT